VKHLSGAPFYGRFLALPTNIRQGWKRYVGDKHSILIRMLVIYGQKMFYNIGPWDQCYKTFLRSEFTNFRNKLECLSLASLPSLVFCL